MVYSITILILTVLVLSSKCCVFMCMPPLKFNKLGIQVNKKSKPFQ